jgi:hypothetical protein
MKRGDTTLAAIRNYIPNPPSLYGPTSATTFPS